MQSAECGVRSCGGPSGGVRYAGRAGGSLNREDVLGKGVVRGRPGDAEAAVAKLADAAEAFGVLHPFSFQGEVKEPEGAREPHRMAVGFAAGGLFVQDGGGLELFGEHQDADFAGIEYAGQGAEGGGVKGNGGDGFDLEPVGV